jgi:hypothetical protein
MGMRGVGQVVYMVGREMHEGFWWKILKEIGHLDDVGVEGRLILKLI